MVAAAAPEEEVSLAELHFRRELGVIFQVVQLARQQTPARRLVGARVMPTPAATTHLDAATPRAPARRRLGLLLLDTQLRTVLEEADERRNTSARPNHDKRRRLGARQGEHGGRPVEQLDCDIRVRFRARGGPP